MPTPNGDLTLTHDDWPTELHRDGACVVGGIADADTIDTLLAALNTAAEGDPADASLRRRRKGGGGFGRRNVLAIPAVAAFATRDATLNTVRRILGGSPRPVRGLLFDKTPDANWTVPWHQDRSIAVHERIETDGYGPWSTKAGVVHVQPPVAVLQQMVTLRLALDDCGPDNGPLRILPGTHTRLLTAAEVDAAMDLKAAAATERALTCRRGDAVLMRPLVLHASSPATSTHQHRRVLHLEYAAGALSGGLRWHYDTA